MRAHLASVLGLTAAWGVFALAMIWPTAALVGMTVVAGDAPDGGFTFTPRQLGLLWQSVWLSCAATALCLLFSIPGAFVVGQIRGLTRNPIIVALLAAPLICPPMVYAFGWDRLLPSTFSPHARCIGVWSLWAWPIPAMLIGSGWSRVGVTAYEAALLTASPSVAFLRVIVPLLSRYTALSVLILFVLFFGDYGVPHACGLLVYATELLGWAAASSRAIDTAWPSIPPVAVTGVGLIAIYVAWHRCSTDVDEGQVPHSTHAGAYSLELIVVVYFVVTWLLPIGGLAAKLASPTVLVEALRTYGGDLIWSLGVAGISGVTVVAMGLGVAAMPRMRTLALVWAVTFGAMPGALIGKSLVAAYNNDSLAMLYDNWPIVALGYVSRFGWIGILTAILVSRTSGSDLRAQAQTDGAGDLSILGRIHLPMCWPTLVCGAGVVVGLSIAEVPMSSLVRVPGAAPIGHIIIEKFHRFEDGMLISLSLWLAAASLGVVAFLLHALNRWSKA